MPSEIDQLMPDLPGLIINHTHRGARSGAVLCASLNSVFEQSGRGCVFMDR